MKYLICILIYVDFIARLRGAVRWLNSSGILLTMCHSMRERARDVLLKKGGRIDW